jgi:hypothetical protein
VADQLFVVIGQPTQARGAASARDLLNLDWFPDDLLERSFGRVARIMAGPGQASQDVGALPAIYCITDRFSAREDRRRRGGQ